jgi:hypothetical protein
MTPLQNASDTLLTDNTGNLPNLGDAVRGWLQPMTFGRVTKATVDHELQETVVQVQTQGFRAPLKPRDLMMKPEKQRAWRWEQLICLPDVVLEPDETVIFRGVPYRVMGINDYREYGYLEYHVTQDYEAAP